MQQVWIGYFPMSRSAHRPGCWSLVSLDYERREIRLSQTNQEREWHRKEVLGTGGDG
jgi:hypothetical protein